jgi:hypothetical protein
MRRYAKWYLLCNKNEILGTFLIGVLGTVGFITLFAMTGDADIPRHITMFVLLLLLLMSPMTVAFGLKKYDNLMVDMFIPATKLEKFIIRAAIGITFTVLSVVAIVPLADLLQYGIRFLYGNRVGNWMIDDIWRDTMYFFDSNSLGTLLQLLFMHVGFLVAVLLPINKYVAVGINWIFQLLLLGFVIVAEGQHFLGVSWFHYSAYFFGVLSASGYLLAYWLFTRIQIKDVRRKDYGV